MDDALLISWLRPSTASNFWLFESKTFLIFYMLGKTDLTICSASLPGPAVNNDSNNNINSNNCDNKTLEVIIYIVHAFLTLSPS